MGFSSQEVPVNGFDWTQNLLQSGGMEFSKSNPCLIQQQQQQFAQPLNCPRCDSTNTKFCYYNNYNRTQPRHYCKSCKRHWTKGGTLRNVPVGGVRKNKRQKTNNNNSSNKSSNKKKTVTNHNLATQVLQQPKQEHIQVSTSCDYQKKDTDSEFLYESLIDPTADRRQNVFSLENSNIGDGNSFMGSSSIDPIPMFQFRSLSSIDHNHQQQHNPSLNSSSTFSNGGFQSSSNNGFNYSGDSGSIESASPWQAPNTGNFINSSPVNWSWEDLNTFISTDLKHPWENDQTLVNFLPI